MDNLPLGSVCRGWVFVSKAELAGTAAVPSATGKIYQLGGVCGDVGYRDDIKESLTEEGERGKGRTQRVNSDEFRGAVDIVGSWAVHNHVAVNSAQ